MHQPLGYSKRETRSEDGMVAPAGPMSVAQRQDTKLHISEKPFSARQNQDLLGSGGSSSSASNRTPQDSPLASKKSMPKAGDIQQEHGPYVNGHAECICKPIENGYLAEEPKTEMEGFIMREHDIDVIQEPVVECNFVIKGPLGNNRDLQPAPSCQVEADGIHTHGFGPPERKVQWVDDFGKELVQVLEYEASDTGDSEEEDDEADAHACACVIQ